MRRPRLSSRAAALPLAALAALAAACSDGSYASVSVTSQTGDGAAVLDFAGGVSVPEGSAAAAHVDVLAHDGKTMAGASLQSANPAVLRLAVMTTDPSGYVLLGVSAGTTQVEVLVNGQQVHAVAATVTAPPASSLPPPLDAGLPAATIALHARR